MKTEYFIVVGVMLIIGNLGFSLYPGKKKWPNGRQSLKALMVATLVFLGIDLFAINWFYRFNPIYVLGFNLGKIPIEEILFFPVVGWGILLLHVNLKQKIFTTNWLYRLVLGLGIGFSLANYWWYTVCVLSLMVVLKRIHLFTVGLTILLTTIFNWYLTARPIVIYEAATKSGLHVGPIPLEDYLFGIAFVLLVVWIYELPKLRRRVEAGSIDRSG